MDSDGSRMSRTERRNAVKCVVGEGLFGTGMGFVAPMTVLVLLLDSLGASNVEVGVIGALCTGGWVLLQPLGLLLFGRHKRTKRFLVGWSLAVAVPAYLAMGLIVYFLGPSSPRACGRILLTVFALATLGAGLALPFWFDWRAAVFRQEIRGRVIGMIFGMWSLGFGVAAFVAGKVEEGVSFPVDYALLFGAASVAFIASQVCILFVREPDSVSAPAEPLRFADLFRRLRHSVGERNFLNYLVGRILMTIGGGAPWFFAVHFSAEQGGGLAASTVMKLTAFLMVPRLVSGYVFGRLGDKSGHKLGIVIGAVMQLASLLVAYFGRGGVVCALSFMLIGIAWSSATVSHLNMLFETCPHDSRTAHITLCNMVLGPIMVLAPLATGWLMGLVGTTNGIGLTIPPTVLGIAWLAFVVREPRDVRLLRNKSNSVDPAIGESSLQKGA